MKSLPFWPYYGLCLSSFKYLLILLLFSQAKCYLLCQYRSSEVVSGCHYQSVVALKKTKNMAWVCERVRP